MENTTTLVTTKSDIFRNAMRIAARQGCLWNQSTEPRRLSVTFHSRDTRGFTWKAIFEFQGLPNQGFSTGRLIHLYSVVLEAEVDGARVDHEITSKPVSSFDEIAELVASVQKLEPLFSDHEQQT